MLLNKLTPTAAVYLGLMAGGAGRLTFQGLATEPAKRRVPAPAGLSVETFLEVQKRIKPQPGESRWLDIPWQIDLHAARQKAAAEGRPLFVMSGGGATAIGTC